MKNKMTVMPLAKKMIVVFLAAGLFQTAIAHNVNCAYNQNLKAEIDARDNFVYTSPNGIVLSQNFIANKAIFEENQTSPITIEYAGLTAEAENGKSITNDSNGNLNVDIKLKVKANSDWGILNILTDIHSDPIDAALNNKPSYDLLSTNQGAPAEYTVPFKIIPTPTANAGGSPIVIPTVDSSGAGGAYEYMSMGYVTRSDGRYESEYYVNALFYARDFNGDFVKTVGQPPPYKYYLFALCVVQYAGLE